mmetsp:Transcript_2845/g.9556  ORF Transcript_2845/g.9556 Transcript_2845/m.9556 type:complete len:163 (-) Transcript_2845:1047-1535(-)
MEICAAISRSPYYSTKMSSCSNLNLCCRVPSSQGRRAKMQQGSLSKIFKFLSMTCLPISTSVARFCDVMSEWKDSLTSMFCLLKNGVYAVTVGAFISGLDVLDDHARGSEISNLGIHGEAEEALGMLERNGFLRAWVKHTDCVDGSSRQVSVTLSKIRRDIR